MKKMKAKEIIMSFAMSFLAIVAMAQDKKDVVDIAISSENHTTLVAAVKAADLVATLKGEGPFTVFAPTNAAFAKLPEGTVDMLLKPENKKALAGILTYHVVAGNLDATKVLAAIKEGMGKVTLPTVAGGSLTASIEGGKVILTDEKGGKSTVTATDLKGSNGVIHVIDTVLMPK
ncbi:MAG: fasciclin domain-containing protein [Cytophagia bacterium]|nr:MAG: fasciclin domain-containing protein [Runella sp.]TAG16938.1 MAG: fasciclin domain-containing protein [Cytophagales bacterium]TAG36062.1 MAG: fasciclin domain-containing protein [Cytophagia bacterium]TAG49907.1 MAG: fasciclin domain-containing protein [Runella slithyformis]TAG77736.1 MAG: fasciclin domain-containing protein [Cytophagales bacterium]